eukprot:1691980-Rhodomonas_salina.1
MAAAVCEGGSILGDADLFWAMRRCSEATLRASPCRNAEGDPRGAQNQLPAAADPWALSSRGAGAVSNTRRGPRSNRGAGLLSNVAHWARLVRERSALDKGSA